MYAHGGGGNSFLLWPQLYIYYSYWWPCSQYWKFLEKQMRMKVKLSTYGTYTTLCFWCVTFHITLHLIIILHFQFLSCTYHYNNIYLWGLSWRSETHSSFHFIKYKKTIRWGKVVRLQLKLPEGNSLGWNQGMELSLGWNQDMVLGLDWNQDMELSLGWN